MIEDLKKSIVGANKIATMFLSAPELADINNRGMRETGKLVSQLLEIVIHAPHNCICHVRATDGEFGSEHTDSCKKYLSALKTFAGVE